MKSISVLENEIRVPINSDEDIVTARQKGRSLAVTLGFSSVDAILIATAISELARNIVTYARHGEIQLKVIRRSAKLGIELVATDEGPGIHDINQALRVGFSTSGSLGLGLPGVKRLVDEFECKSEVGQGTTVLTRKWRP